MSVVQIVKPFSAFGFFPSSENETQYIGDCPFCCGKSKFYVSKSGHGWDCKRCGLSGGKEGFLTSVLENSYEYGTSTEVRNILEDLANNRGLDVKTLIQWGICKWENTLLLPCYGNKNGKVKNIKRFTFAGGKISKLLSTPGCKLTGITPMQSWNHTSTVYLCEGEWDGMAFWEGTRNLDVPPDVLALPGSSVLPEDTIELLKGKSVVVCYDNDDAGRKGMDRLVKKLQGFVKHFYYVDWNEYSSKQSKHNKVPDGFDIRDLYCENSKEDFFDTLQSLVKPVLPSNGTGIGTGIGTGTGIGIGTGTGVSFGGSGIKHTVVEQQYRKWLHLPNTTCLDVMFGTVLANRLDGDPLWLFLVAPSGGCKSELLMSLSESPLITEMTSLTPKALISGSNTAAGDPSLIPKLDGRLLVIKDFTTVLSMNSLYRDEILGILRDAYDGCCTKVFGNGVIREYVSKFGILAGVTPAIEIMHGCSVLGERFIRYNLHMRGTKTSKVSTNRKTILQAMNNLRNNTTMREDLQATAKQVLDMDYSSYGMPTIPDRYLNKIAGLAQWVATVRGVVSREKYTQRLEYKPTAEIGTRLAKQLCKLGMGICLYRNIGELDDNVYNILVHVTQGTVPDRAEEVVRSIYVNSTVVGTSFTTSDVAELSNLPIETCRYLLQDLSLLGIIERKERVWCLSRSMYDLMAELGMYYSQKQWKDRNGKNTNGAVKASSRKMKKKTLVKKKGI